MAAVAINITAIGGSGPGLLEAYGDDDAQPSGMTLCYDPAQSGANMAVVPLGANGRIKLLNYLSSVDVTRFEFGVVFLAWGSTSCGRIIERME